MSNTNGYLHTHRSTPHHRWYASGERERGATGGESTPSTPGGGTEGGGGRRRRRSGSGSSRSDSSSPEPSDGSRASTPRPGHLARTPPAPQSANASAHHNHHQVTILAHIFWSFHFSLYTYYIYFLDLSIDYTNST